MTEPMQPFSRKPRMNQKFYLFWRGEQIKFPEARKILGVNIKPFYTMLRRAQRNTGHNCFDLDWLMWE